MPNQFISNNPGVAALIIGLLFTSLVGFVGWWLRVIRSKLLSHIDQEEKNLIPSFHARIDSLDRKLTDLHIENLKRFSVLDKRLAIMEDKTKNSMRDVLVTLDKLAVKMDRANKDG